jgi:hypothetical protein
MTAKHRRARRIVDLMIAQGLELSISVKKLLGPSLRARGIPLG